MFICMYVYIYIYNDHVGAELETSRAYSSCPGPLV